MNEATQALDPQPLIDALTRQRNEQCDRVAQAEAALFSTQAALQQTLANQAKTQSMLDDTLVAMKQQQDLHATSLDERERIEAGLRDQIKSLESQLDSYTRVPTTVAVSVEMPPEAPAPLAYPGSMPT
jgi:ABC-type transporter Mla subunit MlaD